ncbi:MAG: four helix bundle protein [Bacteroidetes bacterium]|nr:four helix bundle protein [Bacteroidota bacterium]
MYNDFSEMPVWQEGMTIAEMVFQLTSRLPKSEDYGLTSQLRRAAVSISANIAEGFGRSGSADKSRLYDYSRGSALETKSLLIYGEKVNYFAPNEYHEISTKIDEVVFSINKIKKSIDSRKTSTSQF